MKLAYACAYVRVWMATHVCARQRTSSSKGGKRIRLKWRLSRFSRRIMIHIVPHCAMYTGSMTQGISLTNVIAPVT